MKKYQLMAPGPTPVPSEVLLAMAQPIIHHRTPEYEALFIEVRAGLKRLFQTAPEVLPLACSGTGAMEAAVVNTLSAGDTVVGGPRREVRRALARPRAAPTAQRGRADARRSARPSRAERVAEALKTQPDVKAVLVAAQRDVDRRAPRRARLRRGHARHDAILIVDAVSSLGIADLPMDAWGVDVVVSGSQKGLMLPPGPRLLRAQREGVAARPRRATLPKLLPQPRRGAEVRSPRTRCTSRRPSRSSSACARSLQMLEARGAGQRVQAPRPAGARHAGRRGGARARALRQGHAEPGGDRGRWRRPASTASRSSRPTRRATTSRSRAGRAR